MLSVNAECWIRQISWQETNQATKQDWLPENPWVLKINNSIILNYLSFRIIVGSINCFKFMYYINLMSWACMIIIDLLPQFNVLKIGPLPASHRVQLAPCVHWTQFVPHAVKEEKTKRIDAGLGLLQTVNRGPPGGLQLSWRDSRISAVCRIWIFSRTKPTRILALNDPHCP